MYTGTHRLDTLKKGVQAMGTFLPYSPNGAPSRVESDQPELSDCNEYRNHGVILLA
ncbi:hypothetical protein L1N85_22325 [Paenibacillus alkaliterrae]|uniref:hypothetical protein n=1 Tax=Paenibacillus alkaliterrae TaxID=320909 RepID=UPI001F29FF58|nr:hypothetical protein [Paenibacillus alkaliterrae]MCF2941112.1 hypothetical protein [Paenibacillus alkaliterrae]